MVVTAQVWNANVSMEGNLPHFSQSPSSSSLLLLLLFPLIPQYCYTQFPTFIPTSTSLTPILIFTTTPNYILLLVLLLLLFGTQIVLSVQYFLQYSIFFLYLWNWDFSLAKEYLLSINNEFQLLKNMRSRYIYIYFQFQMLMSAPTTLAIQMQHVITLLDPSSVLVRKDLLEIGLGLGLVVTAQVWNANVSMEGNLRTFFPSPSS